MSAGLCFGDSVGKLGQNDVFEGRKFGQQVVKLVNETNVLPSGSGARRIALAGLNPHAGEGGLLGREDDELLVPAVERARSEGIDVTGPLSPDTVFFRARQGDEFQWVLALYHDQGLIAVKTLGFGSTVNWTLGLPYLRTSPDHGTAYDIAGRGVADHAALWHVLEETAKLVEERRGTG